MSESLATILLTAIVTYLATIGGQWLSKKLRKKKHSHRRISSKHYSTFK